MTVVLNYICDDYVVQVSDRRLTRIDNTGAVEVVDNDSNKAIVVCNRISFCYSGPAFIGQKTTHDWLVDILTAEKCGDVGDSCAAIESHATQAFSGLPFVPSAKRAAFVGVGWALLELGADLVPVICVVSNALSNRLQWTEKARPRFSTACFVAEHGLWLDVGYKFPRAASVEVARALRRANKHSVGPQTMARILCMAADWAAANTPTVGRNLMITCLPRPAPEDDQPGWMHFMSGPPQRNSRTFLYRDGQHQLASYGPTFLCRDGGVLSDFTVEPL